MVIHPLQGDDRFQRRCREAKVDCLRQIFIIEKTVRSTLPSHPQFEPTIKASLAAISQDRNQAHQAVEDECLGLRWQAEQWRRRLELAAQDAQCMVTTLEALLTYQRICDVSSSQPHAGSYFATIRLLTHQYFWIYSDMADALSKAQTEHFRKMLPSPQTCQGSAAGWHNHYGPVARSRSQKPSSFPVSTGASTSFQDSRTAALASGA